MSAGRFGGMWVAAWGPGSGDLGQTEEPLSGYRRQAMWWD